jgi:hypothetical protein
VTCRTPRTTLIVLTATALLLLSTWFSATAVIPQVRAEWQLSAEAVAWLTIAVQWGFVTGALLSAMFTIADAIATAWSARPSDPILNVCAQKFQSTESWQATVMEEPGANPDNVREYHHPESTLANDTRLRLRTPWPAAARSASATPPPAST